MRRHLLEATSLAFLLVSAPAFAQPATGDGAKAVSQGFAAYFGQAAIDKGIIAVAPQGDDYKVTVDIQKMLDGIGLPAGSVKIDAFSFLTTPQQGGSWKVAANAFPNASMQITTPDGEYGGSLAMTGYKFTGVYDPKLASFLNASNTIDVIDLKWKTKDAEVSLKETGSMLDMQGTDGGGGAVNAKMHHMVKSVVETVKAGAGANNGAAGMTITYNIGGMTSDASVDAMRSRSILDLWAFLVSLQGVQHVLEHQDDVKARVLATLPLWNQMKGVIALDGLSVQLPFGAIAMKKLTERVAFTGVTPHGEFEVGLGFDGLTIPAGLLPPAFAPLLPTAADTDFKLAIEGLDQVAKTAIADFDAKATPPMSPQNEAKLAGMLMMGKPRLIVPPSRISSPSYTLMVQGELAITMPKPTGKFTVSADGLDKTMEIVQAAAKTNPQLQQAVPILTFIKGLAKPGADGKPSWEIALGPDGAVTVNGQKMGP